VSPCPQGNAIRRVIRYQPREMRLTREDVSAALLSLRHQTREDGRWWSVIDEREIGTPFVTAAIEDLRTA